MAFNFKRKADGAAYWDGEARAFDSIYREDGTVRGWLNRLLRSDMEGRYFFALAGARLDTRPHVLEIGCGTGVHAKGFLEGGAASVTGIDLSAGMLKIASERLRDFQGRVRLLEGDFMNFDLSPYLPSSGVPSCSRRFDVVTAIGVLDYVAEPEAFMKKAAGLTQGRFIASFPRSGTPRSYLRAARLSLRGCPVYFYSKADIEALAGVSRLSIERYGVIGQLHCVVFCAA